MPYLDPNKRKLYDRERHRTKRLGRPPLPAGERKIFLSVRVNPSIVGRMRRLVDEGIAKGTFPWKTMAACVEGLLLRGFESLSGVELVDEMLPYLRAISAIDSVGAHRREAQSAFSKVKTEISELLAIKADVEAVQYYHATLASFHEISETVWRDWLVVQLQKAFPKLHKQRPRGVGFGLSTDPTEPSPKRRREDRPKRSTMRHK